MEQRASERATRTRFEVNAATGPDAHSSGITVQTKLDNPHPSDPFRTGQLVNGHIHISAPAAIRISNLSLQVYYESRTLGWSLEPQVPEQRYSRFTSPPYDNIVRHEVHRGHVNVMRSWDPASVALDPEVALPFSFVLPRRMGVSESSAARERWADQCPPPSLTNSRVCGVQWIVQVVVDLVPNPQEEYDATLLRLSTEDQVVSRLVFPVMPSFEDVNVLRDEPRFSKDLALDPFGSCMLSEEEMVSVRKSTLATVRMRGWGWEAYIRELALQNKCTVASELYTIGGSRITTDILELPLVLFLKRTATQPGRSRSLFRSAPKPKSVHLRRVLVRLLCVTLTRGGNDIRTHTSSRLIRQQDLRFDQQGSPNPALGLPIPVEGSASPLELDLTLDLQSQTEMRLMSGNRVSTPARDLVPSFRTPNIQYEYLLTVSMWFAEDKIERCAARFPVQVIPSDEAQLPLFEDAVAAQPPAFIDDSTPPQYGYF